MKMPDIAAVKAKLAKDGAEIEAALWSDWNKALDAIHASALAQRPKPKSFEVHHTTEVARATLLNAYLEGKPDRVALALNAVGIEP